MSAATPVLSISVLYDLMTLAAELKQRIIRCYLRRHDLSMAEWRLLMLLSHGATERFHRVAVLAAMDKAQASRMIASLVGKGLVADMGKPGVKRSKAVVITPAGISVFHQVAGALNRDKMTEEELDLLRKLRR